MASNNRAASSGLFGFAFQVNCAIVLMLENIRSLKTLRLEGKEDVEIVLEDGSYILAQAKSVVKASTDFRRVHYNLKKALMTLSEASNSVKKVSQLIYITNSSNPFDEVLSRARFFGPSHVSFLELPQEAQSIIQGYLSLINNPLDTSKLVIQRLPFESDNLDERYQTVRNIIGDFLGDKLGIYRNGLRIRLHNAWMNSVFDNGTKQDINIKLTKEDILWPLIVCLIDTSHKAEESVYYSGLEEIEVEELVDKYRTIIDSKCERFEFVTRVITDYENSRTNESYTARSFVEDNWARYLEDFKSDAIDLTIRPNLIKVVISNVISSRFTIDSVKNYCNL